MRSLCIILTLCYFIAVASAIKCYQCQSYEEPNCNSYFDPNGIEAIDCDGAEMPKHLQKYERRLPAVGCITNFYEGIEGQRFFIRRGCLFGEGEDLLNEACHAIDEFVAYRDSLGCVPCYDDLCNTSATAGSKSASISALCILILTGVLLIFA